MIINKFLLLIIGWLVIIFLISFITKRQFPKQKELTRKIIHIGVGPLIPLAWWIGISKEVAIIISFIITIILLINKKLNIITAIEEVERKSYGTIAYAISITILISFFWNDQITAIFAGVLVMAFGDGFAGLIGKKLKSKNWRILEQKKSFAGTVTMAIVTLIVLTCITLVIGEQFQIIKILTISFLAVSLEQISIWGIDNITVPIGVALSWILLMQN